MVIEKQIEAKVIAALETALAAVEGVRVRGVWQSTNDGEIAGVETSDDRAIVVVAVGSPEYDTYLTPTASVPVAVSVSVRRECAPTAAELETFYGPVEDVLIGFQLYNCLADLTALTTDNFRADGVRLDSGSAPQYSPVNGCWSISRSFTVRGVITTTTTNN